MTIKGKSLLSFDSSLKKKKMARSDIAEKSENTYSKILAAIFEAIFFIDLEGKILFFNDAALDLFELKKHQVMDQHVNNIFEDDFFGFSNDSLLLQARKGKKQKKERALYFFYKRKKMMMEVAALSLPNEGVLYRLQDRTKVNQLEAALHHNKTLKEVGMMAARLAHEIRNPLGAITGFSCLLKEELNVDERKKMADSILEATGVLNQLVEQVLSYSQPVKMNMEPLKIATLFSKAVQLLPKNLSEKVEIIVIHKTTLLADEKAMIRLILNLLKNGFEAGSDRVILRADKKGFSVEDFGKGVTKEEQKKIFTPFYTTKITGSGLGLAEVDNIIKSHGFSIFCRSTKQKTTFQVMGEKYGD